MANKQLDEALVDRLLDGKDIAACGFSATDLARLGLRVAAGQASLEPSLERLDAHKISALLSSRAAALWPQFEVVPYVASTNTALLQAAPAQGRALAAEYQFGGRGRRGREWLSPVARNIALSMTWQVDLDMRALEGLSLLVGLAVADALTSAGVAGTALKWPNDLLLDGAKLGGILIELQPVAAGSLVVISVGINYAGAACMRAHVAQPLADVVEAAPQVGRNELLAKLLNSVSDYLAQFLDQGFAGMIDVWNSLHAYHNRPVQISAGAETTVGTVMGVTTGGALKLQTQSGLRLFSAGEVSLRPTSG